ncbi:hypothetical protein Sjap_006662 [Stephania japonica]|uniref:Uncharacterized protein n=1 Tax=Stephania japonica TaxID=461633 RepID=A0AAP0K7U1_9MAGN
MSGSQCCDNPPILSSSSGNGRVEEVGGVKSYVSGSIDSNAAVVLVSDVYGRLIFQLLVLTSFDSVSVK